MRILLVGNPNVGKNTLFYRLTGRDVIASGNPETDTDPVRGFVSLLGGTAEIIVVPGIYSLDAVNEAVKPATDLLVSADVILNVVDATNLERNLNLTLQLKNLEKPMVLALNMWDDAVHKGIAIDAEKLSVRLGLPVVKTSAKTGEGCVELPDLLFNAPPAIPYRTDPGGRREEIGSIIGEVQNLTGRHHTTLERLQDLSVHPVWGIPIAAAAIGTVFCLIIGAGVGVSGLVRAVFDLAYTPVIRMLDDLLSGIPVLRSILIGEIGAGPVDYESALGVLTTGVFIVIGIVLPYVVLFYATLGFLDDFGYLPRAAVLFDRLLHRMGVHGYSIIPMFLGCGCKVPGIIAAGNLDSRRERFITIVLIATTIPCMSQTAMVTRIVGAHGIAYVPLFYSALLAVWITLGRILGLSVGGTTPALLLELPPYRLPSAIIQVKRIGMHVRSFLSEAAVYLLGGIAVINLLKAIGIIDILGNAAAPVITGIFGLPGNTVSAFIMGIVRKDASIALLEPFGLTGSQTIVASLALILYFPCIAAFAVLVRELTLKDAFKAVGIMAATTAAAGGALRLLLYALPDPLLAALVLAGYIGVLAAVGPRTKAEPSGVDTVAAASSGGETRTEN